MNYVFQGQGQYESLRRAAQLPASHPANTSPVPAVAKAALPVLLIQGLTCMEVGAATTVPDPLSTTNAPV